MPLALIGAGSGPETPAVDFRVQRSTVVVALRNLPAEPWSKTGAETTRNFDNWCDEQATAAGATISAKLQTDASVLEQDTSGRAKHRGIGFIRFSSAAGATAFISQVHGTRPTNAAPIVAELAPLGTIPSAVL